jgi:hypothetical protein
MQALAFLDANILAKPFTRTILLAGSRIHDAAYRVVWSQYAEDEGQRALESRFGSRAEPLASIRAKYGFDLSPQGVALDRFAETKASDRQILADVELAGASMRPSVDGIPDSSPGLPAISPVSNRCP